MIQIVEAEGGPSQSARLMIYTFDAQKAKGDAGESFLGQVFAAEREIRPATRADQQRGIDRIECLPADDGVTGAVLIGKDLDEDQVAALAVLLSDAALLAGQARGRGSG